MVIYCVLLFQNKVALASCLNLQAHLWFLVFVLLEMNKRRWKLNENIHTLYTHNYISSCLFTKRMKMPSKHLFQTNYVLLLPCGNHYHENGKDPSKSSMYRDTIFAPLILLLRHTICYRIDNNTFLKNSTLFEI